MQYKRIVTNTMRLHCGVKGFHDDKINSNRTFEIIQYGRRITRYFAVQVRPGVSLQVAWELYGTIIHYINAGQHFKCKQQAWFSKVCLWPWQLIVITSLFQPPPPPSFSVSLSLCMLQLHPPCSQISVAAQRWFVCFSNQSSLHNRGEEGDIYRSPLNSKEPL